MILYRTYRRIRWSAPVIRLMERNRTQTQDGEAQGLLLSSKPRRAPPQGIRSPLSISSCGSVRVLANAAQHNPAAVRTMMVVDPGKLPLCHIFPPPTIQPRAYFAAAVFGKTGLGVVIARMVSGFRMLGIDPDPPTWSRNWTRAKEWRAIQRRNPCAQRSSCKGPRYIARRKLSP